MKRKSARYAVIKRIIENNNVGSQEELLNLLLEEGYSVTQATLSRDLKFLKVGKIPDGKGGYIYVFPDDESKAGSDESLINDFLRGFLTIEFSGNFALIKTLAGHANSVAFAIDHLDIPGVLGTIAGDDTILVVPKDGVNKKEIFKGFKRRIPGLSDADL